MEFGSIKFNTHH